MGQTPMSSATANGASPRPTASQAQANGQRPAASNGKKPIMVRPATAPAGIVPTPDSSEASAKASAPRGGQKPIFRPSEDNSNAEYGLSNEEFEKREANANAISNATRAKSSAPSDAKKSNGDKKQTESAKKTDSKDTAPAKTADASSGKAYVFPASS